MENSEENIHFLIRALGASELVTNLNKLLGVILTWNGIPSRQDQVVELLTASCYKYLTNKAPTLVSHWC